MIERVRGKLVGTGDGEAVVEVGGFSLRLQVPSGLSASLSRLSASPGGEAEVELATHLRVLPDSWQLYGFRDSAERDVFRVLLGIPGIGPRLAMSLLSHLSWQAIRSAVEAKDHARFQAVPGIGKRTAARIVVELAGKLAGEIPLSAPETGTPAADAVAALVALGIGRGEATTLVRGVLERGDPDQDSAELIAAALQRR
jgi:Holliday junction DNA helicase RuvA